MKPVSSTEVTEDGSNVNVVLSITVLESGARFLTGRIKLKPNHTYMLQIPNELKPKEKLKLKFIDGEYGFFNTNGTISFNNSYPEKNGILQLLIY